MSGGYMKLDEMRQAYILGTAVCALYDQTVEQKERLSDILTYGWKHATIDNLQMKAREFLTETQRLASKTGNFVYQNHGKIIAGATIVGTMGYFVNKSTTLQGYLINNFTGPQVLSFITSISLNRWAKATGNQKALKELEALLHSTNAALQEIVTANLHLSQAEQHRLEAAQKAMDKVALDAAPNESARQALLEQHAQRDQERMEAREALERALKASQHLTLSDAELAKRQRHYAQDASSTSIVRSATKVVGSIANAVDNARESTDSAQRLLRTKRPSGRPSLLPSQPQEATNATPNQSPIHADIRPALEQVRNIEANTAAMVASFQDAKNSAFQTADAEALLRLNKVLEALGNTSSLQDDLDEDELDLFIGLMNNRTRLRGVLQSLNKGTMLESQPPAVTFRNEQRDSGQDEPDAAPTPGSRPNSPTA